VKVERHRNQPDGSVVSNRRAFIVWCRLAALCGLPRFLRELSFQPATFTFQLNRYG
jgi:hypothetical protein